VRAHQDAKYLPLRHSVKDKYPASRRAQNPV
jgi:hypothetical protein